jgi:hypothetical protein
MFMRWWNVPEALPAQGAQGCTTKIFKEWILLGFPRERI